MCGVISVRSVQHLGEIHLEAGDASEDEHPSAEAQAGERQLSTLGGHFYLLWDRERYSEIELILAPGGQTGRVVTAAAVARG